MGSIRSKVNLIEYVQMLAEKKRTKPGGDKRGNCMSYIALAHQLKIYSGAKTAFREIDKNYCQGFVEYQKTAVNANNGKRLSVNSQYALFLSEYQKRLFVCLFQRVAIQRCKRAYMGKVTKR